MDMTAMSKTTNARPGQTRRTVIKGAIAGGLAALGLAGAAPLTARAPPPMPANGRRTPSRRRHEADAIKALYGKTPEASDKVNLDAPEIAENGAVVPISVDAPRCPTSPRSPSWFRKIRFRWRRTT